MKRIRVGVIGVGHLGQHHARLYASLAGAVLAGVVDADPDRARLVAERHGASVFGDPATLLGKVDAVSVAVPTSSHYAVAQACPAAGGPRLGGKTICLTPGEAPETAGLAP